MIQIKLGSLYRYLHLSEIGVLLRFTHSRIRPYFSGCGKAIEETINELLEKKIKFEDIPLITVIFNNGIYFSLNNRRLFVIKQLNDLGYFMNTENQVRVRFRRNALSRELERYTIQRCSVKATIMKAKDLQSENSSENEERIETAWALCTTPLDDSNTCVSHKDTRLMDPITAKHKPSSALFPSVVQSSIRVLVKQIEKGRHRQVVDQVKDWIRRGIVSQDLLPSLLTEIDEDGSQLSLGLFK